jgi:hypothetical protein
MRCNVAQLRIKHVLREGILNLSGVRNGILQRLAELKGPFKNLQK